MTLELFKPIEGYPDYLVSSWGRVYFRKYDRFLKPEVTAKGYFRVDLHKGGKRTHCKVHRLVAKAFIKNAFNKPQVNHIDGNKQNNSVSNLEWVTNLENVQKAMMARRAKKEGKG